MQQSISAYIKDLTHSKTVRRRVVYVLCLLSLVVAVAVVWQLKLTGITMTGEAFCGYVEHTHTDECIERVLVCGQEEGEGHTHSVEAGCYTEERSLACGLEEHAHSAEAGCYDADGNLVCELPEHTHADDCYTTELVLTCTQPESAGHTHTDECYETRYICGLEEHVHTLACYSNSQADLETADIWEQSIPALTGRSADDLVSVAVSQLGVSESVQNFQLADDGATKLGYSRYGAWYGNPYGQWGAMFASFCLAYSGNPQYSALANSGAQPMLVNAQQAGLYRGTGEGYAPQAGDLAYIDANCDGQADNVAVVEWVDSADAGGAVHLIQGDSNFDAVPDRADSVERAQYAPSDSRILGYAQLPHYTDGVLDVVEEPADGLAGDGDSADVPDSNSTAENNGVANEPGDDMADDGEPVSPEGPNETDQSFVAADGEPTVTDATTSPEGASEGVSNLGSSDDVMSPDGDGIATYAGNGPTITKIHLIVNDKVVSIDVSIPSVGSNTVPVYSIQNGAVVYNPASSKAYFYAKLSDVVDALQDNGIPVPDALLSAGTIGADTHYFPVTEGGNADGNGFWADTCLLNLNGTLYLPLVNKSSVLEVELFFLPASGASDIYGFDASFDSLAGQDKNNGQAWNGLAASYLLSRVISGDLGDRFYTISVPADSGATVSGFSAAAYNAAKGTVTVQRSGGCTVKLPKVEGYTWVCKDKDGVLISDKNASVSSQEWEDGSTVFTFSDVRQQYSIALSGDAGSCTAHFDLNVPEGTAAFNGAVPTISENESECRVPDTTQTPSITVPTPSASLYRYTYDSNKLGRVKFDGWMLVDASGNSLDAYGSVVTDEAHAYKLAAGDELKFADIAVPPSREVYFKGIWTDDNHGVVNCYVVVDNDVELVGSIDIPWYPANVAGGSNGWKYYLDPSDLEKAYGQYGFKASDVTAESRLFANAELTGDGKAWADTATREINSSLYVPVLPANKDSLGCNLYYLPVSGASADALSAQYGSSWDVSAAGISPSALASGSALADRFYTVTLPTFAHGITLSDGSFSVTPADGSVAFIKESPTKGLSVYVKGTQGCTISLPALESGQWICLDEDGQTVATAGPGQAADGAVEMTLSNVTQHYEIVWQPSVDECLVQYVVGLDDKSASYVEGALKNPKPDVAEHNVTVSGADVKTYKLQALSAVTFACTDKGDTKGNVDRLAFAGWDLYVDGERKDAGISDAADIDLSPCLGKVIQLRANWAHDKQLVTCYAIVDGQAVPVTSDPIECDWIVSNRRMYIKASDIAGAYAAYGFDPIKLHLGAYPFASAMPAVYQGEQATWYKIWANAALLEKDGAWYVPIYETKQAHRKYVDIYYMPATQDMSADQFVALYGGSGRDQGLDAQTIADKKLDTFCTVTVEDDNTPAQSQVHVYRYGAENLSLTLQNGIGNGWQWECALVDGSMPSDGDQFTQISNEDGTTTFTLSKITSAWRIRHVNTATESTVVYNLDLGGTNPVGDLPQVNGLVDTMQETVSLSNLSDGLYSPRSLTVQEYDYHKDGAADRRYHRTLVGWKVKVEGSDATVETLALGESLNLKKYAGKIITLKAKWDVSSYGTVHCYAFVNGEMVLVGDAESMWELKATSGGSRFCVAYSDLRDVYYSYGITTVDDYLAKTAEKTRFFPMSKAYETSGIRVWADVDNYQESDGTWWMPLYIDNNDNKNIADCNVYFIPNSGASLSDYENAFNPDSKTGVAQADFASYAKAHDSFYTVSVVDRTRQVYTTSRTIYVIKGQSSVEVEVDKAPDGSAWTCYDKDGKVAFEGSASDNGKFKFTIAPEGGISGPYTIICTNGSAMFHIEYDMNLKGSYDQEEAPAVYEDNDSVGHSPTYDTYVELNDSNMDTDAEGNKLLSYKLLSLSPDSYSFRIDASDRKYLQLAEFQGWSVSYVIDDGESSSDSDSALSSDAEGDATTLLQPGDVIEIPQSQMHMKVLIRAQWKYEQSGKTTEGRAIPSDLVNFYVSTTVVSEDATSWTSGSGEENFTKSVWLSRCGVYSNELIQYDTYNKPTNGEQCPEPKPDEPDNQDNYKGLWYQDLGSEYLVYGLRGGININATDTAMRQKLGVEGLTRYSLLQNQNRTYKMTFPSDEYVLRQIRQQVVNGDRTITVNGSTVPASELTSQNFRICWYIFKVSRSDGWHVDGVLVAKTSNIEVTKTFAGDAATINAIKNATGDDAYFISVAPESMGGEYNVARTLVLTPDPNVAQAGDDAVASSSGDEASQTSAETVIHPSNISDDGRTYTWLVPVDQYYAYTLKETNYAPGAGSTVDFEARYNVRNSRGNGQDTNGNQAYSDESGVRVVGSGLPADGQSWMSVNFLNTYVASGSIVIQKFDAASLNPMQGVSFKLKDADDKPVNVYPTGMAGDGHYSCDRPEGAEAASATDIVTTDSNGNVYLVLKTGTYRLYEQALAGYDDTLTKSPIELVLGSANGKLCINSASVQGKSMEESAYFLTVDSSGKDDTARMIPTLSVYNHAQTLDVTVVKKWEVFENTPVELQLTCNGRDVPASYSGKITLGGTPADEGKEWSYTWHNMPLYIDGQLAQYSVRETAIGDYAYSSAIAGGYQYYSFDVSEPAYCKGNVEGASAAEADSVRLVVSNVHKQGDFSFAKRDNLNGAVEGAQFQLWQVVGDSEGDTKPNALEAEIDEDGNYVLKATDNAKTEVKLYATSRSNGIVSFNKIPAGVYYMLEYSAPEGYVHNEKWYRIEVVSSQERHFFVANTDQNKWDQVDFTATVVDALAYANVNLLKVDDKGNALAGATFELRKLNENDVYELYAGDAGTSDSTDAVIDVPSSVATTDSDGHIAFSKLENGTYRLTETAAPQGFYRLADPITFVVEDGVVTLKLGSGADVGSLSYSLSDADHGTYTLTVTNHAGTELPSTGGYGRAPFVLGGLVVMIGCVAVAFQRASRQGRDIP